MMRRGPLALALALAISWSLALSLAHAQPAGRPTLRVGPVSSGLVLDGDLSDPDWATAPDSIAQLVTIEPEEGGVPAGATIVKVLAGPTEIVVGIRCLDNEPERIVSFSKARDSDLAEEDHVVIVLDTFLDGRSGYVFAVNPSGARAEGLVFARGEEVNNAWDTIWEARTSRDALGWSAEIRIPIASLAFKQGLDGWGFNVQRRVQRLQETSRWSAANLDYEIFQTSRAGLLSGLPAFDIGAGLSVRPAAVGRSGRVTGANTEYEGDLSLDVTQQIGPHVWSALTVNTDFAETEVDVRQINLTRFPAFFPEKRSFFLAGSDVFEFGLGLDEENLLPLHTRRIGLFGIDEDDQSAIPINAGTKVVGRLGRTHLGALGVNTREVNRLPLGDEGLTAHVPQTTMGAVRVKRDVLEESSVGALATFGDQLGRTRAWTAGLDFTYQTSSFMGGDQNFLVGLWGLLNDRVDLRGDKSAWAVRLDYPNDLLDMNLTSMRIGNGFDPSLGFMPRNDVHVWDFGGEFNPRPPWPFVHQMFHELSFTLFNEPSNRRWESYSFVFKPYDWLLASGDQFEASLEAEGDRPRAEFEVSSDVDIAPGSYEWTRFVLGARSAAKRRVSATALWELGDFYNGTLNTITASVAFKPSSFLTMELLGEHSEGRVRGPDDGSVELFERRFEEALYGVRWEINVSPDLQASNLTQYDTESRELGYNTRVRWTFSPSGDLFVVYNHNAFRTQDRRWGFTSNQVPIKLQYTWRF